MDKIPLPNNNASLTALVIFQSYLIRDLLDALLQAYPSNEKTVIENCEAQANEYADQHTLQITTELSLSARYINNPRFTESILQGTERGHQIFMKLLDSGRRKYGLG